MAKTQNQNKEPIIPVQAPPPAAPSFMDKARRYLPWVLVILVLLAAAILVAIQYKKNRDLNEQVAQLKNDPQRSAAEQTQDIIDKVGKLMVLPQGERPTLATVTDPAKLKDQVFFANAQTGDKVLIYTVAKKAILYRESENKIVEVAPLNTDAAPSNTTADNTAPSNTAPSNTTATSKKH